MFVTVSLPRRRFFRGSVELVIEEAECLATTVGRAREEGTVAGRELDLDVYPVGRAPLDEGRPQPIVDVPVRDIAHHVAPPVDALLEIRERLLDPLQREFAFNALSPFPPFARRK